MPAYSRDLRERVRAAVDRGESQMAAARTFPVARSTVGRWLARLGWARKTSR